MRCAHILKYQVVSIETTTRCCGYYGRIWFSARCCVCGTVGGQCFEAKDWSSSSFEALEFARQMAPLILADLPATDTPGLITKGFKRVS